jgi:cysteine synthase A
MKQFFYNNILESIGNTPLVKLSKIVPAACADIYIKLEYFSPTGSYKDRMALAIVEEAELRGDIAPGMTLVEYTGGSTGASLALICAVKGYHFKAVSSDAFAKEKLQIIRLFGTDLEIVPSEGGKITPDLIPRMEEKATAIAQRENAYMTRQFHNLDAFKGYAVLGEEILRQSPAKVDVFCGAVGTAGMAMGVSKALKKAEPSTQVVVLEPAASPFLSEGKKGSHRIEGIGTGLMPPLLQKDAYDAVRVVEETDARAMARKLASLEGIFAGTSTGLNVCAAIEIAKELGPGHTVVTVACDSGMKYLAGDLYS